MKNIIQMPKQDQRYDQASEWIARLDSGLSADEEIALQEWMHEDRQNRTVLLDMARLWDKMDSMARLSDLFAKPAEQQQAKPSWIPAIAASMLIALAAGLWVLLGDDLATEVPAAGVYQTAVGEQSTVTLSDGTKMVLNTNSKVVVSYTDTQRILHLSKGELYVSVAKDKLRPLSVMAGGQIVQAIGTEFNIEITDQQEIELVVTEGKVKVGVQRPSSGPLQPSPEPLLLSTAVTVSAGEEILLGASEEEIIEVSADEIEVKLSWRKGNLIFRGESLEDAVKEVGRYTSVEFVFLNEDLKKMRVAGLFKAGDVDGLLATLRENFNIRSQRIDGDKVLLSTKTN